jgi:hypothetical protein
MEISFNGIRGLSCDLELKFASTSLRPVKQIEQAEDRTSFAIQ